jgi:bifunctional UDP-N-acetylglucosamine pyrophosphorylase/glucosamine-1-phosphate N-acetyltransferase
MTLEPEDIASFGRVVRYPDGRGCAIVEAKDFDPAVHGPAAREINAGIYHFRMAAIEPLLFRLRDDNNSRELYITDLVGLAEGSGAGAVPVRCGNDVNFLGINNPAELVRAETVLAERKAAALLGAGAIVHAPAGVRIGPRAVVEPGAELFGPCELYGATRIARGARVESHCWIKDASIAPGAVVKPFCHLEGAAVGQDCQVGPYARLRPGTVLGPESKIGNFVETKKTVLGQGAKASHLTYLGDAEIGPHVNVGAGTITCNYDGASKWRTQIGDGAFIGSGSMLVAPVKVGAGATIGAGSTITRDAPPDQLTLERTSQVTIKGWQRPTRKK